MIDLAVFELARTSLSEVLIRRPRVVRRVIHNLLRSIVVPLFLREWVDVNMRRLIYLGCIPH